MNQKDSPQPNNIEASRSMRCSTFRVEGVAFIPVRVGMVVSADTEDDAKRRAEKEFRAASGKSRFIIPDTEDESSVFDFVAWTAEKNT
jgi:hypothetical protein